MSRPQAGEITPAAQTRNLLMATWAFLISFWAWNLIGPLGVRYSDQLALPGHAKALLVATPVLVGAVGRILSGVLTDRFGGRIMLPLLMLISVPFVLGVAWMGTIGSFAGLLIMGFLLGIAGTTFAVGVPFVNAWYDKPRRGFATGIFGAGMGGTALSAFFTPRLVGWFGYVPTHVIIAIALGLSAIIAWLVLRDSPIWRPSTEPVVPKLVSALHLPITWQMSFLYAIAFGGFVAFSTYLPTYLKDIYNFGLTDAGTRTAGFAIAAVVARPIGGVLADRVGAKQVTVVALAGAAVMAIVIALRLPPEVPAGAAFVIMALFLGLGTGGVFAWVALLAPPDRVGSVTGVVGAAGGLGGYFPPLIMGATYNAIGHGYTVGLALLFLVAVLAGLFALFAVPGRPTEATAPPG